MMPLVNKTQHHQPMDEKEDRRGEGGQMKRTVPQ